MWIWAFEKSSDDAPEYTEQRAIAGLTNVTSNADNGPGFFFGLVPFDVKEAFQLLADATGGTLFDRTLLFEKPADVLKDVANKMIVAIDGIVVKPKDAVCVKGDKLQLAIKAIKEKMGRLFSPPMKMWW
jgi:hypothetical protein